MSVTHHITQSSSSRRRGHPELKRTAIHGVAIAESESGLRRPARQTLPVYFFAASCSAQTLRAMRTPSTNAGAPQYTAT